MGGGSYGPLGAQSTYKNPYKDEVEWAQAYQKGEVKSGYGVDPNLLIGRMQAAGTTKGLFRPKEGSAALAAKAQGILDTATANNDPRIWQQYATKTPENQAPNTSSTQLNDWSPYSDFGNSAPDFSGMSTSFELPSWLTQGQQGFNPYSQAFTSEFMQGQEQAQQPTYTHEDLMKGYQDFYNPPPPVQQQAPQQNFGYNALNTDAQNAHSQLMQQYQNQPPAQTTPAATPAAPASTTSAP